jgi:hypothetical protein
VRRIAHDTTDQGPGSEDSRLWGCRAQLFGGHGSGLVLELPRLVPRISVYRNGGAPFAVPGDPTTAGREEPTLVGVYDLVEPVGPETPVYIPGGS